MQDLSMVPLIIGFYMFISSALLLFNIWYIARHRGDDQRHWNKARKWLREIKRQIRAMEDVPDAFADKAHLEKLAEELQNVMELTAYDDGLERAARFFPDRKIRAYLLACMPSFHILTAAYSRHSDMEKAYYVQGMTRYLTGLGVALIHEKELYPFLVNKNIYCRENTLRLLSAMGDAEVVRRALDILAEKGIFHHETLLTGGLITFAGDKGVLAGKLWERVIAWPTHMGVAVVRFIELCGDDYRQTFFDALGTKGMSHALHMAILRYFGKYPFEPMLPVLTGYLCFPHKGGDSLMVIAAEALSAYPGKESIGALKVALSSRIWEVRNNAAMSLMALGANEADLKDVISGQDVFAREMLYYHVYEQGGEVRFPSSVKTGREA